MIEAETAADAEAIDRVVRRAFHKHDGVGDMVKAIRASSRYIPSLAFAARVGGEVVGFVMISGVDLVEGSRSREILSLTPLAVDPAHERQGIGSALVRTVLSAADATGAPLVFLEGSPAYYGRLGFRFAPDYGITIELPDWAPPEAAQVYPLAGYDPAYRGRVVYPPAIAAVSS